MYPHQLNTVQKSEPDLITLPLSSWPATKVKAMAESVLDSVLTLSTTCLEQCGPTQSML